MTRASRIVLIASLLAMSSVMTGVSPAGAGVAITQIAAPTTHAGCARLANATVVCSGLNETGELGKGDLVNSVVPQQVHNTSNTGFLGGVAQVVTGNFFACARLTNGTVNCWGDNAYGQLGNGTNSPSAVPVVVKSTTGSGQLSGVVQIAVGKYHACARISNGTIDCWGDNSYYELGDGTNHDHTTPKAVVNGASHASLTGQVNISIGQYNSCSVGSDGSARCWGLNEFGNVGDGTTKPRAVPTKVKAVTGKGFLANVSAIAVAPSHTCALLKNSAMNCWGLNTFGQLGDGTVTPRVRPVVVKNVPGTAPLLNVAQITVGGGSSGDHTCVRLKANTALCWGGNFFGQLGDATKTDRHRPTIVKAPAGSASLSKVTSIVAGPIATCATITGGGARCWGFNSGGQFGNGLARNTVRPTPAAA